MKAMKFRIKNEAHSKAIQKRLFELGYEWKNRGRVLLHFYEGFLYAQSSGLLAWDNDEPFFNQGSNTETTIEDLYEEEVSDTVTDEVIQDIKDRRELGIKKYGTTLDREDLTKEEWLNHAYEEALDMACYLKKIIQIEKESN